jgi:DNA-binding transcriptional regulator GbsR (MarR family)
MTPASQPTRSDTELEQGRRAFLDLWGRLAQFWGVSPGAARIYGWLLSHPGPADADALAEGLALSRGAVSMALRELVDWGLVHVRREDGVRRLFYEPEVDLERAVRAIVRTRKRREWDPMLEHLDQWIPRLAKEKSAEAVVFTERLESIRSVVALADDMAQSFLAGGVVQELGLKALIAGAKRAGKRAAKKRKSKRSS